MKLIVENLGPIQFAEIDLNKKFYCFVGYNNSGKTYLASLLSKVWERWTFLDFLYEYKINKDEIYFKDEVAFSIQGITLLLREYADFLTNEILPKLFNISKHHAIIKQTKLTFDNIEINRSHVETIEWQTFDDEIDIINLWLGEDNSFHWKRSLGNFLIRPDMALEIICHYLYYIIFAKKDYDIFFLPAERSFYSKFNSYFFRLEQERKQDLNKQIQALLAKGDKVNATDIQQLASQSKNEYSEPMYDLLKKYYEMFEGGKVPQKTTLYEKEVARLAKLIGGEVVIETIDGFPVTKFKSNQESVEDLEMYLASSSVNQLASLMTYFKFWAKEENNLLILDEPEENLHPSTVVKLLEILIDFANKNKNQVLITTHSPLLVEVLNNHLVLGQLENKMEMAAELEYSNETFLAKEDVGIYYFSGKKVYPYEVGEYGAMFRDFKAVTNKIESDNSILSDTLFHQFATQNKKQPANDTIS